jgi:hypothetical protein
MKKKVSTAIQIFFLHIALIIDHFAVGKVTEAVKKAVNY